MATIRQIYPNPSYQPQPNLCLFATWDPDGNIDASVRYYLREIQACGFDIVLISTSTKINEADVMATLPTTRMIIHRKNIGIDFGSWRTATQAIANWPEYESLLFANDSVYGPIYPLKDSLRRCLDSDADVVGMTDSFEIEHHLQSYFLLFKKKVLQSPVFGDFLASVRLQQNKDIVIRKYEVGLSRLLHKSGFKLAALYPYQKIREFMLDQPSSDGFRKKLELESLNQTLYLWPQLIKDFNFPFIKAEVLKINRMQIADLSSWRKLLNHRPELTDLIEKHLRRICPEAVGLNIGQGNEK